MISKVFKSENIKIKRSYILYLHLLVLIIFPIMLGIFYGDRSKIIQSNRIFVNVYETIALASPIMISIVICFVYDRERKAGNFKNWLSESTSKSQVIHWQLIYYWLWYLIEVLLTTLIFYVIVNNIFSVCGVPLIKVILTSLMLSILAIAQYELCLISSLKWGISGALLLGLSGVFLSLLGTTSLLDWVWQLVPWTWQIRLITYWEANISMGILGITSIGFVFCIAFTFVINVLSNCYYKNWEN